MWRVLLLFAGKVRGRDVYWRIIWVAVHSSIRVNRVKYRALSPSGDYWPTRSPAVVRRVTWISVRSQHYVNKRRNYAATNKCALHSRPYTSLTTNPLHAPCPAREPVHGIGIQMRARNHSIEIRFLMELFSAWCKCGGVGAVFWEGA